MKKILLILIVILTFCLNTVFATTNEYIEFSSGEIDDGSIYLDSYEDYEEMMQGMDEQEIYREEHEKAIAQQIKAYDETNPQEIIKARVLTIEDTEEYYSYDNYGTYKIKYQPINVQILEGKYKGQTFDMTYILTTDSFENIKVKEIKENQIINVVIEAYEGEEEPYIYATTVDASVNRISNTIILLVITLILIFIYLGKKGFKILPQLILIADIILLIFVPEMLEGRSIIWMTMITITLYVITNITLKVGLNAKIIPTLLATFAILLITTIGLIAFNNISNMSGIIYEITTVIESFPKGTINFETLVLSIYLLMATVVISDVASMVINTYSDYKKEESREKIKEYVSEKILTISLILFITIIPKYMYMLIAKYSVEELLNSEMLTNEITRIIFLIISMLLTTEVAIWIKKLFIKENIGIEAHEEVKK